MKWDELIENEVITDVTDPEPMDYGRSHGMTFRYGKYHCLVATAAYSGRPMKDQDRPEALKDAAAKFVAMSGWDGLEAGESLYSMHIAGVGIARLQILSVLGDPIDADAASGHPV